MFAFASSIVAPWETQPGSSTTCTANHPLSSSRWNCRLKVKLWPEMILFASGTPTE